MSTIATVVKFEITLSQLGIIAIYYVQVSISCLQNSEKTTSNNNDIAK